MDGRLVFLGFVVVLAGFTARNLQPVRPAGAVAAPEVALLRVIDVDQHRVERALGRAFGGGGARRPDRIEVPRGGTGEDHDEAEEDQASVHGT